MRVWGPVTNPTARALASWLCALWGRHEGARGRRLSPGCEAFGVGRSPMPDHSSFRACGRGPLPTGCQCGGCGRGDPSPTPQRALLRAGFARCGGGTRAPGGGASCLGVGRPGTRALPPLTSRPFRHAAGARFPLAVGAVCGRGGPAVLGTFSRAAVIPVLCALPGFAAPGGRCGLAPVLVPWLWPAACVSGAPGFTGWLRGARGGRPRTGLFVPAAGPCRGKGAWRAPRRTRLGPRDGVVPGGSLRLRSWAACTAVVWRVWTRSLTRPVSRTVRLWRENSAGAPGLFRVDADTSLFGLEDATPGSRARVCVCSFWLSRAGRPPGRVLRRLIFSCGCLVLLLCSAPTGLGLPALWVFFFVFSLCFFFLSASPLAPPLSPAFCDSRPRVPWALARRGCSHPPPLCICVLRFLPPCPTPPPLFFLVFPPSTPPPFCCVSFCAAIVVKVCSVPYRKTNQRQAPCSTDGCTKSSVRRPVFVHEKCIPLN